MYREASAKNSRIPEQRLLEITNKVFRMMGQVHALGIVHGHPHANNIILRGGRVGLIDFKEAKRVPEQIWDFPEHIYSHFSRDYEQMQLIAESFEHQFHVPKKTRKPWPKITPSIRKKTLNFHLRLFRSMIARYPCSEANKRRVLELITERLLKWLI